MNLANRFAQYRQSLSYVGLVFATLFFAVSVAPSLLPRRIAFGVSMLLVAIALLLLVNEVFVKSLLTAANKVFFATRLLVDDDVAQPTSAMTTGSEASLVPWNGIGRLGKMFIVGGPSKQQISEFTGKEARQPIRVHMGLRAQLRTRTLYRRLAG